MTSVDFKNIKPKNFTFGPRRGNYYDINEIISGGSFLNPEELIRF